jgi:hypothetical protein
MAYKISWTKYGGASYLVSPEASYEDLQKMFEELTNVKYLENTSMVNFKRQKDIFASDQFTKDQVVRVMDIIKRGSGDILTDDKDERFLIYNIANVFGYKTETIVEHTKRLRGCNEFLTDKTETENRCGCDYAPSSFWRYHSSNNYKDSIAYSLMPWTNKIGVRII